MNQAEFARAVPDLRDLPGLDGGHLGRADARRPAEQRARLRRGAREDDQGADLGDRGRARAATRRSPYATCSTDPATQCRERLGQMRLGLLVAACLLRRELHQQRRAPPRRPRRRRRTLVGAVLVERPSTGPRAVRGLADVSRRPDAQRGVDRRCRAASGPLRVVRRTRSRRRGLRLADRRGGVTIVGHRAQHGLRARPRPAASCWKRNLGDPSPAGERPCGNIDPLGHHRHAGLRRGHGRCSSRPNYGGPPRHELVALDAPTGTVAGGSSVDLPGVETRRHAGAGRARRSPVGGCGCPSAAWPATAALTRAASSASGSDGTGDPVAYTVPTTREAGIWTPPGPSVDPTGRLFVAVGNGECRAGRPVRLQRLGARDRRRTGALRRLVLTAQLGRPTTHGDLDLGSQGPAFVGHWVFIAGKSGTAYVLRRGASRRHRRRGEQRPVCTSFGGTPVAR